MIGRHIWRRVESGAGVSDGNTVLRFDQTVGALGVSDRRDAPVGEMAFAGGGYVGVGI